MVDFAQYVLRNLESDTNERKDQFNLILKDYLSNLPNLIRGTSVSKFQLERLMKKLGETLERALLVEIPQRQNLKITKTISNEFNSRNDSFLSQISELKRKKFDLENQLGQIPHLQQQLNIKDQQIHGLQQQGNMSQQLIHQNQELQERTGQIQQYTTKIQKDLEIKENEINSLNQKLNNINSEHQKEINEITKKFEKKIIEVEQYWQLKLTEATVSKENTEE